MRAVVESTIFRRVRDVGENLLQRIIGIPQSDCSNSWCVDQESSARQPQQISGDRGVSTFRISRPHRLGVLHLVIEERIHQRAFSGSRFAEQGARPVWGQQLSDPPETLSSFDARHDHFHARRHGFHDRHELGGGVARRHIGLGENHDRSRTRVPCKNEKPLKFSGSERSIETVHQEDNIDVRRQRLLLFSFTGVASHELGAARKYRRDSPVTLVIDHEHDPVTGDGRHRRLGTL